MNADEARMDHCRKRRVDASARKGNVRSVSVSLVERLDNAFMKIIGRHFVGFSMVLAVEIETPFNLSFMTAVIDLMRSRHLGAPFPDEMYRSLFAPFVV